MVFKRCIYLILKLLYFFSSTTNTIAALPPANQTGELQAQNAETATDFIVIPVGINLGKRNVIQSSFVRGFEDGSQAINFDNWLIPFDDVIKALNFKVTPLDSGELELRNVGLVTKINPENLQKDPELGLVFSVEQIKTLLQVPTEFDLIEYAIVFNPPWIDLQGKKRAAQEELPVILDGLPEIKPPFWSISTFGQELNLRGNNSSDFTTQANLTTIGTLLGGSWYLSFNQPDFTETNTWQLNDLQYLLQRKKADYVVGSQSTFWPSQGEGDFWGITSIQRFGNVTPIPPSGGGFNPSQRLESKQIQRTISGEAEPGTLVQLTRGVGEEIIAEVLVDASGIYRFENLPTGSLGINDYRVFLYPNGQLSAEPEIREVNYTTLPGQLNPGTSAIIVSGGVRRELIGDDFLGEFNDLRGGVSYRLGLTEELTVGVGLIEDESVLGLGEIFYQPAGLPLKIGISTLIGNTDTESRNFTADIDLDFDRNFRLILFVDEDSQRFNISSAFIPGISFRASGNTRDNTLSAGIGFNRSFSNFSISTGFEIDTNKNLRWNINSRLANLQLNMRGNEDNFSSEFRYNFSRSSSGSSLILDYETSDQDYLTTISWRYLSPATYRDGRSLWEFDIGYGIGSRGNGLIASVATPIIPGLTLQLVYEQISLTSDNAQFRLQLRPTLNLQPQLSPGDFRFDRLRSEGGMLIQPYFDRNNNGKRDRGEEIYTEEPELLVLINNETIRSLRPFVTKQGIFIRLPPETYRLDLDPAGFPLDWAARETAYAVEVVAGIFTPVAIPLSLSYTVAGTVTDAAGNPIAGATVEAIPTGEGNKVLSITNGAGIFYLEQLKQGTYNLVINGQAAQPRTLEINENSKALAEVNLQFLK